LKKIFLDIFDIPCVHDDRNSSLASRGYHNDGPCGRACGSQ
jgi:hypothetical protein